MTRTSRRNLRPLHGILLLDKPLGLSSSQALQKARFLFQAEKAGHTGSLDPLASGMLPLCFGEATKMSAYLLDSNKRYITTATLGQTSSTGDKEGELSAPVSVPTWSLEQLESFLAPFRGEIQQVPPMYSALKKDGKKLYELARQGIEVERASRSVTIDNLSITAYTGAELSLDVSCSKGTYIRTLVEDIGAALGCGAYVSALHRVSVSPFEGQISYSLPLLQATWEQGGLDALDQLLLPLDCALPHLAKLILSESELVRVRLGQKIVCQHEDAELVRLYDAKQQLIGLGSVSQQALQPKRVFVL